MLIAILFSIKSNLKPVETSKLKLIEEEESSSADRHTIDDESEDQSSKFGDEYPQIQEKSMISN